MMRRSAFSFMMFALIAIATLGSLPAHAAKKLESINSTVEVDLPVEIIRLAIVKAGAMRGWEITEIEPGVLQGYVRVRSEVAVVDIRFDTTHYTITYNRSENLNYKNGKIDKRFNEWIHKLDRDIQAMFTYM